MIKDKIAARQRKMNENSLKNIENHKWVKGQSGNPKGRTPKSLSLPQCIESELEALSENGVDTNAEVIAKVLIGKAKAGNIKAAEMALDYISGRPSQSINLQSREPWTIIVKEETDV